MTDNTSNNFKDWDDEHFLGYVEIHSQTERAMFSREMLLRLCDMADVPQAIVPDDAFTALHYREAKVMIDRARAVTAEIDSMFQTLVETDA